MVYKKNLVAVLKVDGKVLREQSDKVELPFGSEYSILLKNLDSVRVRARIEIDGKDATDGTALIIGPNSNLEIERYIRNGNLDRGNKFKFIERTEQIEKARGIEVDDGLIRIEFKKEKVIPAAAHVPLVFDYSYKYWPHYWPYWYSNNWPYDYYKTPCGPNGISYGVNQSNQNMAKLGTIHAMNASFSTHTTSSASIPAPAKLETGITVPGSESQQKFSSVVQFVTEEQSEVLVLHLVGYRAGKAVKKAVTVDVKPVCLTCSLKNKPTSKFCSRCGTALEII